MVFLFVSRQTQNVQPAQKQNAQPTPYALDSGLRRNDENDLPVIPGEPCETRNPEDGRARYTRHWPARRAALRQDRLCLKTRI